MLVTTFEAVVVNGRLEATVSLQGLEGQRVQVTLTTPVPATPPPMAREGEPEPPEWLEVEKDLYVPMPLEGETLKNAVVIEGGPLQPCLVVPEDYRDGE